MFRGVVAAPSETIRHHPTSRFSPWTKTSISRRNALSGRSDLRSEPPANAPERNSPTFDPPHRSSKRFADHPSATTNRSYRPSTAPGAATDRSTYTPQHLVPRIRHAIVAALSSIPFCTQQLTPPKTSRGLLYRSPRLVKVLRHRNLHCALFKSRRSFGHKRLKLQSRVTSKINGTEIPSAE